MKLCVTLGVLMFLVGSAASRDIDVDAYVELQYDRYAIDTTGSEPTVCVLILTDGTYDELTALGVDTFNRIDFAPEWVNTSIPIRMLTEVAVLESVQRVVPTGRVKLHLNDSRPYIRAPHVHTSLGYTGKGVIVGIIDLGVDVSNEDFLDVNGNSRILFYWHQEGGGSAPPPDGYNYGSEWTGQDIDQNLFPFPPMSTSDGNGHGSLIAGIIAGDGSATDHGVPTGTFKGVAPDASIIVAAIPELAWRRVVDGVEYILKKAEQLDLPCVINLSVGTPSGPRDGTSLFEFFLSEYLRNHTGKAGVIVVSAGNRGFDATNPEVAANLGPPMRYARNQYHSRVEGDGQITIEVQSTPGSPNIKNDKIALDIFYTPSASTPTTVRLTIPQQDQQGNPLPPYVTPWYPPGGSLGPIGRASGIPNVGKISFSHEAWLVGEHEDPYPLTQDNIIMLDAYDGWDHQNVWTNLAGGDWIIELKDVDGPWDAYLVEIISLNDSNHSFVNPVESHKLDEPANAEGVITVGSVNTKNNWYTYNNIHVPTGFQPQPFVMAGYTVHDVSWFSSPGPTRDGRLKPEVFAPGAWIASSTSSNSYVESDYLKEMDGVHSVSAGTSFAAPHVAGVVALMMEKNPDITRSEIEYIVSTAKQSNGCIDAVDAVNMVDWCQIDVGCCTGMSGNVDNDPSDQIDIGDLTALIDFLLITGARPACWKEANVNGDSACEIDISDLTYLVDYLFMFGSQPPACL